MLFCHVTAKITHTLDGQGAGQVAGEKVEETRQFIIVAADAAEVESRLKPFEEPGVRISWEPLEHGHLYELRGVCVGLHKFDQR